MLLRKSNFGSYEVCAEDVQKPELFKQHRTYKTEVKPNSTDQKSNLGCTCWYLTSVVNPMNRLLDCNFKRFFKSVVVTSVVKFNSRTLVFTFKYEALSLTFYNISDKTLKKALYLVTSM